MHWCSKLYLNSVLEQCLKILVMSGLLVRTIPIKVSEVVQATLYAAAKADFAEAG